jgi:hypothetical protein
MEARGRFVGKNSTDKIKVENFNKNAVFGRGVGDKHISKPTQNRQKILKWSKKQ